MTDMRLADFIRPRRTLRDHEQERVVREATAARAEARSLLDEARDVLAQLATQVKADEIAPLPRIRGYDDHGGTSG